MAKSLKTGIKASAQVSIVYAKDVCTTEQVTLFGILLDGENALDKAHESRATALSTWLASTYGDKCPTFEQYRNDQTALAQQSAEFGLKSPQVLRKAYAFAVNSVYGALPVSMDAKAVAKRKARDSKGVKTARAAAGSKKGELKPVTGEPANVEQLIAKFGILEVFRACQKILASDNHTVLMSKTVGALAEQLPSILKHQAA
jgi:hypothetical protein